MNSREFSLETTQDERLLAALAHASVLLPGTGLVVPLALWITQWEKSSGVAFHALQALIYQVCLFLMLSIGLGCYMISFAGAFVGVVLTPPTSAPGGIDPLLGAFLLPIFILGALFIAMLLVMGYALVGALMSGRGKPFQYPVIGPRARRYVQSRHDIAARPPSTPTG